MFSRSSPTGRIRRSRDWARPAAAGSSRLSCDGARWLDSIAPSAIRTASTAAPPHQFGERAGVVGRHQHAPRPLADQLDGSRRRTRQPGARSPAPAPWQPSRPPCSTCARMIDGEVGPARRADQQGEDHVLTLGGIEAVQRLVQQQQVGLVRDRRASFTVCACRARTRPRAVGGWFQLDGRDRVGRRLHGSRAPCGRRRTAPPPRAPSGPGHGGLWSGTIPTRW